MKIWCWWPTYLNTYSDPDSTEWFPAGTEGQNATMNHIKVKILHLSKITLWSRLTANGRRQRL